MGLVLDFRFPLILLQAKAGGFGRQVTLKISGGKVFPLILLQAKAGGFFTPTPMWGGYIA